MTGDTWEQHPELRLEILRLISKLGVEPAEAWTNGAAPSNRGLLRSLSRGKRGGQAMPLGVGSKAVFWQDALDEIYHMPVGGQ